MNKVLEVVTTETLPKSLQFRESGAPKDLTGYTITCKISTDPVTTKTATIVEPTSGVCSIPFNGLPAGSFVGEIIMTTSAGVQPSEVFTINVRSGL